MDKILEILFVKRLNWGERPKNQSAEEWVKAYLKTNKLADIRLYCFIGLSVILLSLYVKFFTVDNWEGKTFQQIFLGRSQHAQDSVNKVIYAKIDAAYKYKIGQKVKLLNKCVGIITDRTNERLVGIFIFPVIDNNNYYIVSYIDNQSILHREGFTEEQLSTLLN